jgi:hypothetical protein
MPTCFYEGDRLFLKTCDCIGTLPLIPIVGLETENYEGLWYHQKCQGVKITKYPATLPKEIT